MSEASALSRIWAKVSPWLGRLGTTREDRVFNIAIALCVASGLVLRARGFFWDVSAFWIDEAQWAILLMEQPLVDLLIRPPGFMAVSKVIALVFGPTEMALRAMPFIAGVAAVLFAPSLARRLFTTAPARLLFVAVIALHPCLTSFAKEFKPYEVSVTLHLLLVLLTLRYVETRRPKDLAWVLGAAFLGGPFAQDLVFAYPGVFLVLLYDAFRHRRRHLPAILASAAAILTVLVLQYVLIWSKMTSDDTDFWAKKYRVFHTSGTYLSWFVDRYQGVVSFPGFQMMYWDAHWLSKDAWAKSHGVAIAVWLVLHVVGLVVLFLRRRFRVALLVVLPIFFIWLFNLVGFWPFGVFRANLFLIGCTAAIAATALDRSGKRWRALTSLIPAAVLVVIPFLWFEKGWGPSKRALTYTSQFPAVLEWLAQQRHDNAERLLVDRKSCDPFRYYSKYGSETKHLAPKLEKLYRMECIEDDSALDAVVEQALKSDERPLWILFNIRTKTKPVIKSMRRQAEIITRAAAARHTAIAFGGPLKKGHAPPVDDDPLLGDDQTEDEAPKKKQAEPPDDEPPKKKRRRRASSSGDEQ